MTSPRCAWCAPARPPAPPPPLRHDALEGEFQATCDPGFELLVLAGYVPVHPSHPAWPLYLAVRDAPPSPPVPLPPIDPH